MEEQGERNRRMKGIEKLPEGGHGLLKSFTVEGISTETGAKKITAEKSKE